MTAAGSRAVRVGRFGLGVVLLAPALALTVRADLGLGPWHVLQQGLSRRLDVSLGTAGNVVTVTLVLVLLAMRERPGLGTPVAIMLGNLLYDLVLPYVPVPTSDPTRALALGAGLAVLSLGVALMLSAQLGAGPLDLVTLSIFRRVPFSFAKVRLTLEGLGLLVGWVIGGDVGVGTVVIGLGIGPAIQGWLRLIGAMPRKDSVAAVPPREASPTRIGSDFGEAAD